MSHVDIIKDADAFFDIDPITRVIRNNSPDKNKVMQFDHNSERFTFTVPKFIESHDMLSCKVSIHYTCVDEKGVEQYSDRYDAKDLQVHPEDDTKVIFSWLISKYATQYAGLVHFSIRFVCENEDGSIDYSWGTDIFKSISVSKSIYNSQAIAEKHSDVLDEWKREVDAKIKELSETIGQIDVAVDNIIEIQNDLLEVSE